MLTNRLAQSIGTFVLTLSIARILGTEALGQYVLAFSYYFIFVNIASQGFKTLFTRELSREASEIPLYFVNGALIQLLFGSVGYVALVAIVALLPYSAATSQVCYLLGLTIIPFALSNVTEAIFQAQEKMHLIAVSTVPVYLLRLLLMIAMMRSGYGVNSLAGVFLLSETLILAIQTALLINRIKPKWTLDRDFIWRTVKAVRIFLVIEGVSVINGRIDILVLSLLGNELLVGLYGGIVQLIQPFTIIATSVSLAAFPKLSQSVELGQNQQRQIAETITEILLLIALPLFLGFLFLGDSLLKFVYATADFSQAAPALRISAIALVTAPFCFSISYSLFASGLERINLRETIVTTVLGGVLGIFLVSKYQLVGAALMNVCISLIAFAQFTYAAQQRLFNLRIWRMIRHPLLVSSLMMPVLIALHHLSSNFIVTLTLSISAYALLLALLSVHIFGDPRVAWAKLVDRG
jgi:O-antigen/teichoic acid export membrane protein